MSSKTITAAVVAGIAGIIFSTTLGTIKSIKQIQTNKPQTKTEIIKLCWKNYILTFLFTGITITLVAINDKAKNDIINKTDELLKSSEAELTEFKKTVATAIGEKQMIDIYDQHNMKKMQSNQLTGKEVCVDGGHYLIFESEANKYFRSDIDDVKKCINKANWEMSNPRKNYISHTELLNMYGVTGTDISDYVGWNYERDGVIDPLFTYGCAKNGEPCCIISYKNSPHSDYECYSGW